MINACAAAMITMRLLGHGIGTLPVKHLPILPSPIVPGAVKSMDPRIRDPKTEIPNPHSELRAPNSEPGKRPDNDQTPCTLQVVDQDLPTMLRLLSDKAHVSLVLLSASDKKITTNLVNLPFVDVLHHLCALSGLNYLKVGPIYVVATQDKLESAYPKEYLAAHPEDVPAPAPQAPTLVTQTYYANYVSSTQLAESLGKIFPADKLTVLAGPVQANPTVSSQETMSSTGVQSNALSHDDTGTSVAKMLILRGDADTVNQAIVLAKQMDTMRPQVAIEVKIYDISDTALNDLGISWTFGDVDLHEVQPRGVNFGSFARAPLTFSGVIKALSEQDKAKVLASPNISVLDGERAFILIGDRINYPVLVGYSQNNAPIFSKEEERVGIYMQVAANVSSDDNVTLNLYPQVSSVTGFLNVNGASYPQISTREAQTTLRVHSGETIVMGGLMKTEETASYDRVPLFERTSIPWSAFPPSKGNQDRFPGDYQHHSQGDPNR